MGAASDKAGCAFLLLWNPQKFAWDAEPEKSFAWCVRQTALGVPVDFAWRIGHSQQMRRGDRVFLLRTNRQRGLLGAGHATADVHRSDGTLVLPLAFDMLLPPEDVLPLTQLQGEISGVPWNRQFASGNRLAPPLAAQVESLWQRHLQSLVVAPPPVKAPGAPQPDAADPTWPRVALSIRQPHVEAILRGIKCEEYRNLATTVRERVLIYATKARYEPAEERAWLRRYGLGDVDADRLPHGVLAGTVEIVGCRPKRAGFAWELARPVRLERPCPPTGMPQPMWFRPFP